MTTTQSPQARLAEAFAFFDHSNPAHAERAFQDILIDIPSLPEARFGVALARMSLRGETIPGDVLEQIARVEHVTFAPALVDAGRLLTKFGAFALGASALRKAQQSARLAPDALSRCALALENAAEAESAARDAVAAAPHDIDARFQLGRALSRQGKWEDAAANYRAVLDSNAKYPSAASFLAEALYATGRLQDAEAMARVAIEQHGKDIIALGVAAKCALAAGRYAEAEDAMLVSVRAPNFSNARASLFTARSDAHEYGKEHAAVVRAFWPTYGEILRGQGWYEQALAEAKNPIADVPEPMRPEVRSVARTFPDQPKVTLVTFSDGLKFRIGQERVAETALTIGEIDEVLLWTGDSLKATAFYRDHAALLNLRRGSGYWAWKPFLLYNELLRRADGEIVVYYDSGDGRYAFTKSIRDVAAWCRNDRLGVLPCTLIPSAGKNKIWTKRDCFQLMDCDSAAYWEAPQVVATFSVWRNSPTARDFVRQWMAYCLDPRIVTDYPNVRGLPNDPDFIDHRHDQSVLANLIVQRGVTMPVYESKDINGLAAAFAAPP